MAKDKEENAHITETAPKNIAKPPVGISQHAYVPGSALTRDDIVFIAQTAWDAIEGQTTLWADLDGSTQRMLFDTATDICLRGGATTAFEVSVAENYTLFITGAISPDPPIGDPPADEPLLSNFPTGSDLTPGLLSRQIANLNERLMVLEGTAEPKEIRGAKATKDSKAPKAEVWS